MKFFVISLLVLLSGLMACRQGAMRETEDTETTVAMPLDEMVSVGSHSLHIHCRGAGSPTVVIDTGFADSYTKWQFIQDQLSYETRVCAYERAGYGLSEPGPFPRSGQQIIDELEMLLENADIEPPYVLVGHSLGGLNMQLFASQHPDLVAGAILLAPSPLQFINGERFPELYQLAEQQTAELWKAAEASGQATDPEEEAKASYYQTLASEHAMLFAESAAQIVAIQSFGDLPLIVLASGKPNPAFGDSAEAFQKFWIEQSQTLAAKSTNGVCIVAEESGHYLHTDAPDLVLGAIRQVLEQGRE